MNLYKLYEEINKSDNIAKLSNLAKKLSWKQFKDYDFDKEFYGFSNGEIINLNPTDIMIKYQDDLENAIYYDKKYGIENYFKKPLEKLPPIEVTYKDKKFWLEDGHHRWLLAKKINKKIKSKIFVDDYIFKDIDEDILSFYKKHTKAGTLNERSGDLEFHENIDKIYQKINEREDFDIIRETENVFYDICHDIIWAVNLYKSLKSDENFNLDEWLDKIRTKKMHLGTDEDNNLLFKIYKKIHGRVLIVYLVNKHGDKFHSRNSIILTQDKYYSLAKNVDEFIKNIDALYTRNRDSFFHEYKHYKQWVSGKTEFVNYKNPKYGLKSYINQHYELDSQFHQSFSLFMTSLEFDIENTKDIYKNKITKNNVKDIIEKEIFQIRTFNEFKNKIFTTWEQHRQKTSSKHYKLPDKIKKHYISRIYQLYSEVFEYAKKQLLNDKN